MGTAFVIAGKDLRQQLGNGVLLLFGVVLPLGLAFLFNSIIPEGDEGFQATYAVADADGGPAATAFARDVLGAVASQGSFEVRRATSPAEANRMVEQQEVSAAFIIPYGFSSDVETGRPAQLQVVGNADAATAAYVASVIAESYAAEIRGTQLAVAVTIADAPQADPAQLAEQARQLPLPLTPSADPTAAVRELDSATYYAAGMAVFFLLFVAMLSVSGILEERTNQTMARLLAAPVSRAAILAGKLLGGVIIGLFAMTVLVASSTLLFGASWGPMAPVALLVVAVVLAATGLMALIATAARTTEQATNWMSVVAVVLGMFGGSFVPLAQMGDLAVLGYATPHRWFLQGLSDLAGGEASVVLAPAGALLAFAAIAYTLTALRIGKVIRP